MRILLSAFLRAACAIGIGVLLVTDPLSMTTVIVQFVGAVFIVLGLTQAISSYSGSSGEGSFKQRTRIMAPDGVTPVLEGKELDVALKDPVATHTNIENFLGVAFREPGVHWVEISLDGELRMRYPFAVRVPPPKG